MTATREPITCGGWYEHTDGTWGRYEWGGKLHTPQLLVTVPECPPPGAVAYKYADPTEGARFVLDARDAREIHRADPSLLIWIDDGLLYEIDRRSR